VELEVQVLEFVTLLSGLTGLAFVEFLQACDFSPELIALVLN